ncbi:MULTISPECIES: YhcN/YlaJ family sporulation lipoprotein [Neobacillus]|uniref:YhcN/YlaJ family sporulation lipoprotein n=1 Tax=Neobacillus sedimentimangrovi TaxID=2699460 RepID=A0ABS8QHE5_9BACI|nr:YhcN/YlaJ family sporulation lipoprotein [Neobacillus sedimentimangrovi]MCD4838688.1 YhcN/YlaJ family sporulation lipoprotein [Neobacillus sedimentimangrovi]
MNKKQWMIPFSVLALMGAAGCANNTDQSAYNNGHKNSIGPVGYYSNENHPDNNYRIIRDNDGALPELMDHTIGEEDQEINETRRRNLQEKDENGHPKNPSTPLAKTDRNFFQRDNRFSRSDANYHGHLNKPIGTGSVTKPGYQEDVTDQIRSRVRRIDNVRSIRSVAYGNTVEISVKLFDNRKAAETKRDIKNAVRTLTNGRPVNVIIDEGTLGRDRNINNEVRQPEP